MPCGCARESAAELLQRLARQQPIHLRPQKLNRIQLIARHGQAKKHQVQMVRHQAIRRAQEFFADTRMKQCLPELVVKAVVQPTRRCRFDSHGPMDCREALIVRALQSGEVMEVWIAHGLEIIRLLEKSQPRSHERSHDLSGLIHGDFPLRRAAGEIGPVDVAKARRIVFPMPRFVLVGIPAEILAA